MDLAAPVDLHEAFTPLDRYLAEQRDLSAVERFARRHDRDSLPAQARYYRDLIPMGRPGPGEQYGFEVDLDACTGCKACVTACHALNGLDDGESWRSVGTVEVRAAQPFQQTVTTACHHCLDPACLAGCPVNAYEKDPVTGIVAHLDDQCIGCRYCVLTCPYEVPRYNPQRGIVRKCDLCADRLAASEAPACVQSCPNAAIRIALVDLAGARAAASTGVTLVPGAPASSITVPSTTYNSRRDAPVALLAGTSQDVAEQPLNRGQAHLPLTVMLVLTQLAVGASVVGLGVRALSGETEPVGLRPASALVALGVGLLALGASVLHLGRPAFAFRAVLGIRRSWLSREIVAFGVFAVLAGAHGVAVFVDAGTERTLGALAAGGGVIGVACSAQVYAVTRRGWWALATTATKFFLTTVATGAAAVLVITLVVALVAGDTTAERAGLVSSRPLGALLAGVLLTKLAWEAAFLRHLRPGAGADLRRSARLLVDDLGRSSRWRFGLGSLGALTALSVVALAGRGEPVPVLLVASASFTAAVAGELVERWQFFTAAAPARMPSGPQ